MNSMMIAAVVRTLALTKKGLRRFTDAISMFFLVRTLALTKKGLRQTSVAAYVGQPESERSP